ncbi:MAG: hypothetical protein ACI88H_004224 [Cocleimonas sp.]|jgi:hypothetical protein
MNVGHLSLLLGIIAMAPSVNDRLQCNVRR